MSVNFKFRFTSLIVANGLLALTLAASVAQDNQLRTPSEIDGSRLQGGKPTPQQTVSDPAMTKRAQVAEQLLRE